MSVRIRYATGMKKASATKTIVRSVRVDNTNADKGVVKVSISKKILPKSLRG